MSDALHPVSDLSLQAYVDGQLDGEGRAEVEGYLAHHPDAAARVMADLHLNSSLRVALASAVEEPSTLAAARRLSGSRRRMAMWRRIAPALPVVALLLGGAAVLGGLTPLSVGMVTASSSFPAFVTAAMSAHQTSKLRLEIHSQPEVPDFDPVELRAATGILLPEFPANWAILAVQVFPSPQGPGIQMVFETDDLGLITLFAVRPGDFALAPPRTEALQDGALSWARLGETTHVLIAERGTRDALQAVATDLFEVVQ